MAFAKVQSPRKVVGWVRAPKLVGSNRCDSEAIKDKSIAGGRGAEPRLGGRRLGAALNGYPHPPGDTGPGVRMFGAIPNRLEPGDR